MEEQKLPSHAIPSIGELFSESWKVFVNNILSLFVLSTIAFGSILALFVAAFALFLGLGFALGFLPSLFENSKSLSGSASVSFAIVLILVIFLTVIGALIIGTLTRIGSLIVLHEPQEKKMAFGSIIKKSLPKIVPVLILDLLIGFAVFGGFFLLIIPALIFSYFFLFAPFIMVYEGAGITDSLKKSYVIATKHFSDVFPRVLLLYVIIFAVGFGSSMIGIVFSFIPIIGFVFQMLINMVSVVIGWYGLSYIYVVYTHSHRLAHDTDKPKHMIWVWVGAAIGWAIGVFVMIAFIALIVVIAQNEKKSSLKEETKIEESIETDINSSFENVTEQ